MNYYIQGNAAKAQQIKAAFEAKGCVMHTGIQCDLSDMIYFSLNGKVGGIKLRNLELFKTHPDYKELELPAEPKLKVGDWVVKKDGETFYGGNYAEQITLIEVDEKGKYIWLPSKTWIDEDYIRLWTIEDAKDGDILATTKVRSCPFIYRKTCYDDGYAYYYVGIDGGGDLSIACPRKIPELYLGLIEDAIPATNEQRDLLFAKMKDAGYEWDAGKKELRKIKPHYDIDNFKPKQWVLVRDDDEWEWALTRFSYLSYGSASLFVCINGASFQQCIPFEGNETLLGTTDMCNERFVNW